MTVTETTHMRRISDRRGLYELPGDDGQVAYIGVWVDGVQVAAAVRQDDGYAERHNGARWSLWSGGLSVASFKAERTAHDTHTLALRDEHDARAWLDLIGDIAEHGPSIVDTRQAQR